MATVDVLDKNRQKVDSVDLPDDIFNVEVRSDVLHQLVRWQLAKRRQGDASTKTRTEVRGGGRKPWRQKGTGRARVGTIRSPLWKGGGVAHGPKPRSYDFKVNKKVRALALKMALSDKLANERLMIVDSFDLPEIKTKLFSQVLGDLEVDKALVVIAEADEIMELSGRNVSGVKVIRPEGLNVYDLLKYDHLLMLKPSVDKVVERLK